MLSPLQRRVAAPFRELPDATEFALAGGGALILHGEIDRLTRDLDYFAIDPPSVDRVLPVFEAAARASGLMVTEEQVAPGFARVLVSDGTDETRVDIAADARLLPTEESELGPVLSVEELAVDKILAVFGRAEARDFVDLAALEPQFGLEHLCDLAARKDPGFQRSVFLSMLDRLNRLDRDEFDVDDDVLARTIEAVARWRETLRTDRPR